MDTRTGQASVTPLTPAKPTPAGKTGGQVLDLFLAPRSVAIIGLSRSAIGSPISVLTTLEDFGYPGTIYVINPSMTPSAAEGVYAHLEALPEAPDLAIVSVARERVLGVLQECHRCGIRAAIVITQGFADADAEGQRLQSDLTDFVRTSGLRVLGPNTIGVANARDSFTSSFIELHKDDSPIGQVAQSGLFMMGHHLINNEPAGFCKAVDLGNASDIGLIDVLEYYEQDGDVRVIQCHLESVSDGTAFVETASRISRDKPIIVLKAGKSQAGQRAVASHTGAAAGESEVYRAAFRKAGAVIAETAEDLRLLSKAFATYRTVKGRRVAVMTFSGGGAILAIDAIEAAGLTLASLSEVTRSALQALLPSWLSVDNPVDVWIPISSDFDRAFPLILETLLQDPGVDAVICIYCSYTLPKYAGFDSSRHIGRLAAAHPDKPVLCWTYGLDIAGFTKSVEKDGTTMVFPSLESAASSMAKLCDYHERRHRPALSVPPRLAANDDAVDTILRQAAAAGRGHLFTEAFEVLSHYGLSLAPWALAQNRDQLLATAEGLSYPLCLKVVSSDIVHKSDSGGIALGIADPQELLESHDRLLAEVGRRGGGAVIEGVALQEMAPKGQEIMIGAKRDAAFGPCLVVGAGGIYTEFLADYAFRLAPLDEDEARAMIAELKVAKLLAGVRGEAPCHLPSIVDALLGLSQLMCTHAEIQEIDINPLIVGPHGAVAVDARIILEQDNTA